MVNKGVLFLISPLLGQLFLFFDFGIIHLHQILLFIVVIVFLPSVSKVKVDNFSIFCFYSLSVTFLSGLASMVMFQGYEAVWSANPSVRFLIQFCQLIFVILYCIILVQKIKFYDCYQLYKAFRLIIVLVILFGYFELFMKLYVLADFPATIKGDVIKLNSHQGHSLRIHSLLGEPRFLATFLVTVFWCDVFYPVKRNFIFLLSIIPLLFLTKSTSGFLFFIILPVIIVLFRSENMVGLMKSSILGFVVVLVISLFARDVVTERVVERLQTEVLTTAEADRQLLNTPLSLDAPDLTPAVLALSNPEFLVFGVGINIISNYVRPILPYYGGYWGVDYKGVVEPNLGFLKILLSYGIIGVLMTVIIVKKPAKRISDKFTKYYYNLLFSWVILICTIGSAVISLLPVLALIHAIRFQKDAEI